ncbi:adenosylcobinamide-GDP ribazoletransferase [Salinactinospora qingdaonensis]
MALGTLTAIPVPGGRVDRNVAAWAMALAPVVGLLLGGLAALVLLVAEAVGLPGTLGAALAVAALAVLTRGLHLDGMADLADGLGSARPAAEALEIMRRSDIGPFGVITLVCVLLIQVLALGSLAETSWASAALGVITAVTAGRLAITWACTGRVPSARPEGLGAFVAGTVPVWAAALVTVGLLAVGAGGMGYALALLAGPAVASGLLWHAIRRIGGITGDVLGALSETATTVALLVAAATV